MTVKRIFKKRYLLLVPLIALIIGLSSFTKDDNDDFELIKHLEIFHTLMRDIRIMYVDETSSGELIKKAMDEMLKSLDPYTVYYPESLVEDVMFINTGTYAGIGADIETWKGVVTIIDIEKDSPADQAGLMIGDIILKINDKDVKNMSVNDMEMLVKGQPGTSISMTFSRNNEQKIASVKRAMIKEKAIPYYGKLSEKTGYINLSGFTEGCSKEFKAAFMKLKSEYKIDKLVIDLRNNPGGLLIEAVEIVNLFVDKGEKIVEMKGRVEQWNKVFKAESNPVDTKIPIVVLVNGNSASAAEIVSGALQDLDRAVIIGEKTFGKGLVQTTKDLAFNSKLKITTAKYYIPSGRCIQKLDYSHKDSEGKATQYTDYKTFKTKNGRMVKDAGGILPDIIEPSDTMSYILEHLIGDNIIFDFATQYRLKHNEIKNPEEFEASNEDIAELKKFAGAKLFDYQTDCDILLKELMEEAEKNHQLAEVSANLTAVKQSFTKQKEKELQDNINQIKKMLSLEIIKRYYYTDGVIRYNLKHDPFVTRATSVLNDAILYKKVITETKK